MIKPGKIIRQLLQSVLKKPATTKYPASDAKMPEGFRGKLLFHPEKCIGCQLCMKDCPAGAIRITKKEDGKLEAEIELGKCIYCGQCVDSCIKKALEVTSEYELAQLQPDKLKIIFK